VAYSLPISASKIFLLKMVPGCVFNSLFMTQSFVFPFLGFPSTTNSPSESGNLIFTSDIMPSLTFNVITPSSEIISGQLIIAKE